MPYLRKGRTSATLDRRIAEVEAAITEQSRRLRHLALDARDASEAGIMLRALQKTLAALVDERRVPAPRTASERATKLAPAAADG